MEIVVAIAKLSGQGSALPATQSLSMGAFTQRIYYSEVFPLSVN